MLSEVLTNEGFPKRQEWFSLKNLLFRPGNF